MRATRVTGGNRSNGSLARRVLMQAAMNKSNRKKLTLSRESLRALQQDSLERVAGGIFESVACSYQYTCKNWQTCGWLCTYTLTKKEA